MKLLDPLNGIKFSQMHYMWHLTMFFAMFTLDTTVFDKTLVENKENALHDHSHETSHLISNL